MKYRKGGRRFPPTAEAGGFPNAEVSMTRFFVLLVIGSVFLMGCNSHTIKYSWFNDYGTENTNAQAEIKKAREAQKNQVDIEKPSRYYYIWDNAVVDTVKQPSMVVNGSYIPEHKEMVILNPGGYKMKERPRRKDMSSSEEIWERDGHERGNEVSLAVKNSRSMQVRIYDTKVLVGKTALVLRQKVLFMMKKSSLKVVNVKNGGTVTAGKRNYILERDGDMVKVSFMSGNKLKTVYLDPEHVLVTDDGAIVDIT